MPDDTLRYQVELDTQGLSAQLASVRDVVAGGLQGAAQGLMAAGDVAAGAVNRISSDLMAGQQLLSSSVMAQSAIPTFGAASTNLANVPGMPQSFMSEVMSSIGLTRGPLGVFPSQFQAMGRERLQERVQMAATGVATGAAAMGTSMIGGAIGQALIPIPVLGAVVGQVAGGIIGDHLMAPVVDNVQEHMMGRARIQQIFGFNKFDSDQRTNLSNFMSQQFAKSIFSPDEFNAVLPSAVKAGFFRGVGRGDVSGFKGAFTAAEQAIQSDMFSLQLTGPEGIEIAGELRRGFRRMGVGDPNRVGRMFSRARVLAQDMMELGEFVDPTEIIHQQQQMGSAALQMGASPQRAMELFSNQASMVNRMVATKQMTDEDLALLGGTPGEAAQRLTMGLMSTQRQPIFRAMAMAFGQVDAASGRAGISQAGLEAMSAGRMNFGALSERLTQQFGTGQNGTTKALTLLANQQKLGSDMMVDQGQMMRSMTDDILRQANLEVTDGTRQFIMQRVFGQGEAESRALAHGLPMEKADRERLEKDTQRFDKEVKGALQTANTGVARDVQLFVRELKDTLGEPLNKMSVSISERIAPSLNKAVEHLESLDRRVGGTMGPELSTGRVPVMTGFGNFGGSPAR